METEGSRDRRVAGRCPAVDAVLLTGFGSAGSGLAGINA